MPQKDSLRDHETTRAQAIAKEIGTDAAAKRFGVDARTFRKAILGEPVHRLTAYVIRSRLESL